jgi:hypothetical protein
MAGSVRKLLLLVTICCVVVVLIAPSVDLPDTSLRALQNANNVMLSLVLLVVTLVLTMILSLGWRHTEAPAPRLALALPPWLCTFLF